MKKLIFALAFAATALSACDDDDIIDETIWVSDSNNRHLPAYTEWGYNTFGARVNDGYFISRRYGYSSPCRFTSGNDNMLMEMTGYDDIHYGLKDDRMVGLNIDFKFQHIAQYKELIELNGKSFDLSDNGQVNAVELVFNSWQERGDEDVTCRMTVERGTLTFSKVMLLRIDEDDEEAIVAGTFEIYGTLDNGKKYHITKGRFDFGVNERNLF